MTDSAQPVTAAESLDAGQLEGTFENLFSVGQPDTEEPKAPVEQEAPADPAELNLDDLEDEAPKPPDDDAAFEIVHNGQTLKLSRDEVIENARKGFDYTQKTMAVAETQRQFQAGLQRLAEVEQVQPLLAQDMAQLTALHSQLNSGRYSNQEMLKLAREDPFEHAARSEERNILTGQLQQLGQQYQQKEQAVKQYRGQLEAMQLQQEAAKLPDVVPAWKDPARLDADKVEIAKYLQSAGVDLAQAGRYLDSALAMKVVYQSMRYEQLLKARTDKSKLARPVPPVIRPGANAPSDQGKTTFAKVRQGIKQAGQRGDHRTQEEAMVSLLNRTFKK